MHMTLRYCSVPSLAATGAFFDDTEARSCGSAHSGSDSTELPQSARDCLPMRVFSSIIRHAFLPGLCDTRLPTDGSRRWLEDPLLDDDDGFFFQGPWN